MHHRLSSTLGKQQEMLQKAALALWINRKPQGTNWKRHLSDALWIFPTRSIGLFGFRDRAMWEVMAVECNTKRQD